MAPRRSTRVVRTDFVLLGTDVSAVLFRREGADREIFLGEDFLNDFVFDIGQAEITPRLTKREDFVVDTERGQSGGIQLWMSAATLVIL
jgi:hypothetical protein